MPLYNTETGHFRGIKKWLRFIRIRRDPGEVFHCNGYDEEKSKILYSSIKHPLPNIFQGTAFKKHVPHVQDQSKLFSFWVLLIHAPTCTQFHPPPPSWFQPPPSSLQHPQQYLNQNIARNWAIYQKNKCCPFWLKIDTHDKLEVLILNRELDFWNSDPKIHFWANLGSKLQSCVFCLKIDTHSISRMLIPNPDLDLWSFDAKIHFLANLGPKSQSCPFCLKIGKHGISRMLILIATLVFWISNPNFLFGQIWTKKVKVVCFV